MFPGVVSIRTVVRRAEHTAHSRVLLLKPEEGRFAGQWRLPGGEYRGAHATCEDSAASLLFQETGLTVQPKDVNLRFVASEFGRDTTQRDIALVYRIDFREHRTFLDRLEHSQHNVEFRWVAIPEILVSGFGPIVLDHRMLVQRACTGFSR